EHSSEPASKSVDPFPIDVERADAVDGQEEAAESLDELSPPYMLKFNVPSADFEEWKSYMNRYLLRVSIRGKYTTLGFRPEKRVLYNRLTTNKLEITFENFANLRGLPTWGGSSFERKGKLY
ncbi:6935_t:CDS:2, partial [Acaulospora morrowiae]